MQQKEKFTSSTICLPSFNLPTNNNRSSFNYRQFYHDLDDIAKMNRVNKAILAQKPNLIRLCQNIYNGNIFIPSIRESLLLSQEEAELFVQSISPDLQINPVISSQKRILIIFSQSDADLSPFLFERDPLLRGFFLKAKQTWFFGGRYDALMIIEYQLDAGEFTNPNSMWNRFLSSVTRKFPALQLQIYELEQEERFFNKDVLFTDDWRKAEYLHLSPTNKIGANDKSLVKVRYDFTHLEVSGEHHHLLEAYRRNDTLTEQETQELFQSKLLYYPHFFKWQFWQISGYTFSLCLMITNPGKKGAKVKNLLYQLPIGEIFFLQDGAAGDGKERNPAPEKTQEPHKKWVVFLHLRESIPQFLQKFISLLDAMRVTYTLSPVLPLSIYERSGFAKKMILSQQRKQFFFKTGELIDMPVFPLRRSIETFSLEEYCMIEDVLNAHHDSLSGKINKTQWKNVWREITLLWEKQEISPETLHKILQKCT